MSTYNGKNNVTQNEKLNKKKTMLPKIWQSIKRFAMSFHQT